MSIKSEKPAHVVELLPGSKLRERQIKKTNQALFTYSVDHLNDFILF